MSEGEIGVQPWAREEAPTEAAMRRILRAEGLQAYGWSNMPGDVYTVHSHPYHKVIYVVKGSITFGLPDTGERVALRVGDRLELPVGVAHDAVVGSEGVVCLEAHQR